jgi:hypothetical protein
MGASFWAEFGDWYLHLRHRVGPDRTRSELASLYTISINGQEVANINYTSYGYLPGPSPFYLGPTSIGIGGWQDQDANYRFLTVDRNGV